MHVSGVRTLNRGNENALGIWERKILRKIFGSVRANSVWKIRTNQGLMDLCGKNISQKFGNEVSLLGHVKRTPEERTVAKMFKNIQEGKGSVGEPRNGWLNDVKNDLKKIDVKGLQKK